MRIYIFILTALLALTVSHAKEYGNYEPKRILAVTETPSGKSYGIDVPYLDQMLNDLSLHAKNYPPQFDTPQDQQRATQNVVMLSGMLDILINGPAANPELLIRAGLLNSIGHNLDISGSAEKATGIFQRILTATPSDPKGNFLFGTFLARAGKPKEALPYLEKARAVGVADADYAIGMTYLSLGEKDRALENLEAYKRRNPNDGNIDKLIDAIRNGKIEFKKSSG